MNPVEATDPALRFAAGQIAAAMHETQSRLLSAPAGQDRFRLRGRLGLLRQAAAVLAVPGDPDVQLATLLTILQCLPAGSGAEVP